MHLVELKQSDNVITYYYYSEALHRKKYIVNVILRVHCDENVKIFFIYFLYVVFIELENKEKIRRFLVIKKV